jgi:hypothetical protein
MGIPISRRKERLIRELIGEKRWSGRKIAQHVGCAKGTVYRIRRGQRVKRRSPSRVVESQAVEPYRCDGCTTRFGHVVIVNLRPCVACRCHEAVVRDKRERVAG